MFCFFAPPAIVSQNDRPPTAIIEGLGEVDERFKSHAWKACVGLSPPRVRIPPSPPNAKNPCKSSTYKGFLVLGGSKTGSNMLGLPIYLLGSSYYLHTRIGGKQVKRSLRTSYQRVAIIRAITLLDSLMRKDLPQKYELDLSRGILKASDDADHARLMQALQAMQQLQQAQPQAPAPVAAPVQADDPTALKLAELLEKFLLLKKVTQATAIAWLCCTNQKRAETTPTPDAATPQQAQAPLPGAQVV